MRQAQRGNGQDYRRILKGEGAPGSKTDTVRSNTVGLQNPTDKIRITALSSMAQALELH